MRIETALATMGVLLLGFSSAGADTSFKLGGLRGPPRPPGGDDEYEGDEYGRDAAGGHLEGPQRFPYRPPNR